MTTRTDDDSAVFDVLRRCIVQVAPHIRPEEVAAGRTLADLGCNSIDRAEILTLAMCELDVTVPLARFVPGSDIAALVGVLREFR